MKKLSKKSWIIVLIIFPLILVLAWLLYTNKISFNLFSKASNTPDYIICAASDTGGGCNSLYSGSDGLFRLFHDSSVALDLNNDGQVYIQIKEGIYKLAANALSSVTDQDRSWIKLADITKGITIEGSGSVVLDGSSYLGGIYAKNVSELTVSGIKFDNLATSTTTYCKTLTDSCPVGRGIVLDKSTLVFNNGSILNASNGSAILYNASKLTTSNATISNLLGVGITVKDSSTLTLKEKTIVSSANLNAISLVGTSSLVTSSTGDANEISRTKDGSGDTGYTILAADTAALNIGTTTIKSYGGGILLSGANTLKLDNSSIAGTTTKEDSLLVLKGTSKVTSMTKTAIKNGLYGIHLTGTATITSIESSSISNNTNGIYVVGSTTADAPTIISSVKTTTFTGNTYGIFLKNLISLKIGEGTIFDSNTGAAIKDDSDAYRKAIVVDQAEFKNNAIGILSYAKTAGTKEDLIVTTTKFSSTASTPTQTGISVTGQSMISVTKGSFNGLKNGILLGTTATNSITDSSFNSCSNGIEADASGALSLFRNKFSQNSVYGLVVGTSVNADTRNNIFDKNATAVYFKGNYNSTFVNNVVANSTVVGISLYANTSLVKDYNNVYYQNKLHVKAAGTNLQKVSGYNVYYPATADLFKNFTVQITSYKADPQLDTTTWTPLTSSITVKAGNPDAAYNNTDGTRNTIGITGGPKSGISDTDHEDIGGINAVWNLNETKTASCVDGKDVCDSGIDDNTGEAGNYNGTLKGTVTSVASISDYGKNFDGKTGNYVDMGDVNNFELQSFTIGAVFKKTGTCSTNNYCTLVSKGASNFTGYIFGVSDSDDLLSIKINDGGTDGKQLLKGKTKITDNTWYYAVVVVDEAGKSIKLYLNGALEASGTFTETIKYGGEHFEIGNGNDKEDLTFNGIIDYAKFTAYLDSATDVSNDYKTLVPTVSDTCGNGTLETAKGEACDDGNKTNGDGCNSTCTYEADLNKDGKVTIAGDYGGLHNAIKNYLFNKTYDAMYDMNGDKAITINGDYVLFLKAYKYYLKSLL